MVFPKAGKPSSLTSVHSCIAISASPVHLMSLPAFLVALLVLLVFTPVQTQPLIPGGNSHIFPYKRYCSTSLADAMKLICDGRYDSASAQYPDSSGTNSPSDDVFPPITIHECCRRPCGLSELKMFCLPV